MGNTRLDALYVNHADNYEKIPQLVKAAFEFFNQAWSLKLQDRELPLGGVEEIEKSVLENSFFYLKKYYAQIKKEYDHIADINNRQNRLLTGAWINQVFKNPNHAMAHQIQTSKRDLDIAENKLACLKRAANYLRQATIDFVMFARDRRNDFINTVTELDEDLRWHLTDEKERKNIIWERQIRERDENPGYRDDNKALPQGKAGKGKSVLLTAICILIGIALWAGVIYFLFFRD